MSCRSRSPFRLGTSPMWTANSYDGTSRKAPSLHIPSKASLELSVSYAHPGDSVDIAEVDEPCDHSVQFGGMCANCGKDMTEYVCQGKVLFSHCIRH